MLVKFQCKQVSYDYVDYELEIPSDDLEKLVKGCDGFEDLVEEILDQYDPTPKNYVESDIERFWNGNNCDKSLDNLKQLVPDLIGKE